jgi:uncharacterized protein
MNRTKKHPSLDRKKDLYLKDVGIKGRGVFCRTAIKKGEVLEITPAVILDEAATDAVDSTTLMNYNFIIGNISKKMRRQTGVKRPAKASCVIFGVMTFCNHDEKPNAEIVWEELDGTLYYELHAKKAIPAGTEICTSYGKTWFADRGWK